MTSFEDAMRRAGFGTDEAGDARRREEMGAARLTGYLTAAQWRELGRLTPEDTRAISDSISRALGSERQPVADHPPVPGHLLTYRHGKAGTEVTCECGRWDGWYNGPRSRSRVLDDHAGHVAAELRADGPIKVQSERLVKCEVCPFLTGCREGAGPCRAEETGWTPRKELK